MKTFGQIGYEAYCAHTGGKSLITGSQLPTWDALMPHIREAWEAAGEAIKDAVEVGGRGTIYCCNLKYKGIGIGGHNSAKEAHSCAISYITLTRDNGYGPDQAAEILSSRGKS